ncbi:MAG: hypothetical protein IKM43_01515 [Clostridia bacterium]|nr:hypothetical protein [Clostridia bacterium]
MSTLLSFVSPLEFLLRYTVITGVLIAIAGVALCLMAKRITMLKRKQDEINKSDRLYITLMLVGLGFILIGMIIIALPIDATFYIVG